MSRPRGLMVTGTDTGVGKTYVSCLIIAHLREQGRRSGAYKPVCSGAETDASGRKVWEDVEQLWAACAGEFPREQIAPQTFDAPLAPPRAALVEGRTVDESQLLAGARWWEQQVDWLVVEGAGGLLAPLSAHLSGADLAGHLGYPLLIVARAGLGTINHTLLTLEVARHRGLRPAGILLNAGADRIADSSIQYNWEDLAARTQVPVWGVLRKNEHTLRDRNGEKILPAWTELFDFSCADE